MDPFVIARAVGPKQSRAARASRSGLLRRFAPRNDGPDRGAPSGPRSQFSEGARERLLQTILDLVDAGAGAGLVELGARRAARPDGADHLLTDLDDHAAAEEHDVRKLRQDRDAARLLGALGERQRVGPEGDRGIGLVAGAIDAVNAGAVAAHLGL